MKSIDNSKPNALVDEGLRAHMINVYNTMGLGLLTSAVIAYVVGTSSQLTQLFLGGPQAWLFILAPLALVFWISFKIDKMSFGMARILFYVYAATMGISLASLFALYQIGSIFQVFLVTATMFGATSLYGYTTNRDLSGVGSFLFMGLIGLIAAALINIFLQNTLFQLVISAVGVLVFTGLTAYDTQKIREIYYVTDGENRRKAGVMGALTLYLDFVNLLMSLMQLLGQRK